MSKITLPIKRVEYVTPVQPLSHLVGSANAATIPNGTTEVSIECTGLIYNITPAPRDPTLDLVFDCSLRDSAGNPDQGKLIATTTILGTWVNTAISATALSTTLAILGTWNGGIVVDGLLTATLTLKPDESYIYFASAVKENWVKWSNIGSLDFTVWKDNIAGERPLDWKGFIYSVRKLGNKVVAYGENGVSILIPAGNTYGLQTIHGIGLKGKQAVAGDNAIHFFVDTEGKLFMLGEMAMKSSLFEASMHPENLDYSEYLEDMNDLVLSWNEKDQLLYICDGATGYVYSPQDKSLGKGPESITGFFSQGGASYITSPAAITTPAFEICTDIYDFGTHKNKTIHELEIGTNVTGTLQARIDYRDDFTADFSQTDWKDVSTRGTIFITALGREFRFRLKLASYEYLELDYISIKGIIHDQ